MEELAALEQDEGKFVDRVHRGERAKGILEDELYTGAFDAIEKQLEDWLRNGTDEQSLDAKNSLRLLKELRSKLEHHMNTGKIADANLSLLAKLREQMRRIAA